MRELSVQQIFRLMYELEPTIVRDFVSALKLSTPESAFERFEDDQENAEEERRLLRLDAILTVATAVVEKRRLRNELDKNVAEGQR
jgi:hypothetical protein